MARTATARKEKSSVALATRAPASLSADQRTLNQLAVYRSISTDAECVEARKGMQWLKDKIKAIKTNKRALDLIAKTKAAYEAARSVVKDAAAPYEAREKEIREEVSRFESARELARLRTQSANRLKLSEGRLTEKTVETRSGDVFEFEAEPEAATLVAKAEDPAGTGSRAYHYAVLVDPEHPTDKDGNPLENVEKGMAALVEAIAKGKAPIECVQLNADEADKFAEMFKLKLAIPGLACRIVMRPIIGAKR